MNQIVDEQRDCDICLQPKGLTQVIENRPDLPKVCYTCVKSINTARGWFRRHALILDVSSDRVDPVTGEISENGATPTKDKAAR